MEINSVASAFTPLEIMPRFSAAGLDFRIIPAGFNAPLEFLTGFTADGIFHRPPAYRRQAINGGRYRSFQEFWKKER